ncbi:hypothetical protein D1P53_002329 [Cryptococcus gattii VGV]|nr:hypothetical protein D1P53_002329 [Cryptococcus gattii VGV]
MLNGHKILKKLPHLRRLPTSVVRRRLTKLLFEPFTLDSDPSVSAPKVLRQFVERDEAAGLQMPEVLKPRCLAFALTPILDAIEEIKISVEEISLDAIYYSWYQFSQTKLYAIVLNIGEGVPGFYVFLEKGAASSGSGGQFHASPHPRVNHMWHSVLRFYGDSILTWEESNDKQGGAFESVHPPPSRTSLLADGGRIF